MKLNALNFLTETKTTTPTMPLLFVGHGSPMNAIEENEFVAGWRNVGKIIPKPKAIICISAHWETKGTFVTASPNPKTIHDFGGFPRNLYEVEYPAPGSPELASEVKNTMTQKTVLLNDQWGLDHGAWSVIKHIYPKADIPVIELSIDYQLSPKQHFDLAKDLAILRNKGVLIIGSGNLVHNLGLIAWDKMDVAGFGYDWAIDANNTFKKLISEGNYQNLVDYKKLGTAVNLAIPTPDHFIPLLYVLALKNENEPFSFFNDKAVMGSLTMTSVLIGQ